MSGVHFSMAIDNRHRSLAEPRSRSAPRSRLEHCVNSDTETKAGASTPATRSPHQMWTLNPGLPPRRHALLNVNSFAQRRPGLPPRRHARSRIACSARVNAQRRPGLPPRRHSEMLNVQRNPGRSTLNEGRGFHPGDTRSTLLPAVQRSGASTPATRDRPSSAQRRPGLPPRRHSPTNEA